MADLIRRTVAELINSVGAIIDMDITVNSSPNKEEVKRWLTDGAVRVFRILPDEVLVDCNITETFISNGIMEPDLANPVQRITAVKLNRITCSKLTENDFDQLNLTPYRFTVSNPAYCVVKHETGTKIRVYPENQDSVITVSYLPVPFSYIVTEGEEGDAITAVNSVTATIEPMIVDFATIMYRSQDEEPGQFQLYLSEWKENVKLYYQVPTQNLDGS